MGEERQTNYTIAEGYELPSKGLIYEKQVEKNIVLRSMTARDEMKRLSPSATPYKTLADIIEGCCIEKPAIHVYDMSLGDYEFLLHKLRIVTYGDSYNLGLTCPYCGEVITTKAHLNELEVKEFDMAKFEAARTFTLPKSERIIALNIQTPHMLDNIELKVHEMKRKFKSAEINFEAMAVLLSVIDTVDGNKLDQIALEQLINNLPAMDMLKIMQSIDDMNACIGINNELYITCESCGSDVKTFFRFGPEFFRPSAI